MLFKRRNIILPGKKTFFEIGRICGLPSVCGRRPRPGLVARRAAEGGGRGRGGDAPGKEEMIPFCQKKYLVARTTLFSFRSSKYHTVILQQQFKTDTCT